MEDRCAFDQKQIGIINNAVELAEELVSNHFKMSANQWLRPKYDIKTLAELAPDEIIPGPFAQIIRYKGRRDNSLLGSSAYDFYKICLQDHSILAAIAQSRGIELFPLLLYIVTHELIHIVRFSKFLQNFDAAPDDRIVEESRVHQLTHDILLDAQIQGLSPVMLFYRRWRQPFDNLKSPAQE